MTDLPRQFKGVWIPAEVWLDRSLSITEKVMMVEIGSLQDPVRGCYASNSHFARFFGLSSSRVSEIISALSSKGLLRVELIRDGRQVVERRVRLSDLFGKSNTYSEKAATLFGIKKGQRMRRAEAVFAALGDDKEERIQVVRQKISISETRRTPVGRSTARAAHLATIGKVLRAIDTLPFQVQQFGHYLYHPAMNMRHLLNAVLLITAKAALPDLTSAKRVKAQYLVTLALQSYKGEVAGSAEWGPARVPECH